MPATISSCLNSCGLCGRAYQEPGLSRAGTRKSRAPSGVERVSVGVSISTKSRALSTLRAAALTSERSRSAEPADCRPGRRRSRYRCLRRASSPTVTRSSTWKGRAAEGLSTSMKVATTSTSPVARSGLTFRSSRAATWPTTVTTNSLRRSWAAPVRTSSRATTCTTPLASRTSRKATPPWSRRFATHPARVTVCPVWAARRVPASWVRSTDGPSVEIGADAEAHRPPPAAGPRTGSVYGGRQGAPNVTGGVHVPTARRGTCSTASRQQAQLVAGGVGEDAPRQGTPVRVELTPAPLDDARDDLVGLVGRLEAYIEVEAVLVLALGPPLEAELQQRATARPVPP